MIRDTRKEAKELAKVAVDIFHGLQGRVKCHDDITRDQVAATLAAAVIHQLASDDVNQSLFRMTQSIETGLRDIGNTISDRG